MIPRRSRLESPGDFCWDCKVKMSLKNWTLETPARNSGEDARTARGTLNFWGMSQCFDFARNFGTQCLGKDIVGY